MRQVPMYGIIGAGHMARHFIHYLQLLSIPFQQWSRAENNVSDLDHLIQSCNPILILINDDAIELFITDHPHLKEKTLLHFSGALYTKLAVGAHPLMTFADDLYALNQYQKIPFILDNNELKFSQLMPGIPNPHHTISPEMKHYYHCMCSMSGNFTSLLWQKMFEEMTDKFNIPHEMIHPYLEQICQNLLRNQAGSLTGPFVRNDKKTISKHLDALTNDKFLSVYQGFLASYFNSDI